MPPIVHAKKTQCTYIDVCMYLISYVFIVLGLLYVLCTSICAYIQYTYIYINTLCYTNGTTFQCEGIAGFLLIPSPMYTLTK